MTIQTMIKTYKQYVIANLFIIGFIVDNNVYAVEFKNIPPRFLKQEKASSKNGGGYSLRLRIPTDEKMKMLNKATYIGTKDILKNQKYNKGDMFEKAITELNGQRWEKDNTPFWKASDLKIGKTEIQIKLDTATICTESNLKKAKQEKAD